MFTRLFRNRFGQGQSAHGGGAGRGRGGGSADKPGSGPEGYCVCLKCGHREPHIADQRCLDRTCPKCGTKMTRS